MLNCGGEGVASKVVVDGLEFGHSSRNTQINELWVGGRLVDSAASGRGLSLEIQGQGNCCKSWRRIALLGCLMVDSGGGNYSRQGRSERPLPLDLAAAATQGVRVV